MDPELLKKLRGNTVTDTPRGFLSTSRLFKLDLIPKLFSWC